jgi:hypothetical protein
MNNSLLAGCVDGTCTDPEQSITAAAQEALHQVGVAGGAVAASPMGATRAAPAQTPFHPPAPDHLLNSPRAQPWDVLPPAVQRLTPIGLSPLQAAAFLGTSRSRIYRLLREGRLLALKQGVATIVTLESLQTYAASLPAATFGRGEADVAA